LEGRIDQGRPLTAVRKLSLSKENTIMTNQSTRLATSDELIVNEKIFGECNHRDWARSTDRFGGVSVICVSCGQDFPYNDKDLKPSLSEKEFLLSKIRKYSEDMPANVLLRKIESAGWRALVEHRAGNYVCTFEKGYTRFSSNGAVSMGRAICDAAARLGSSGQFAGPVKFA
jgi:hypothetical protein